MMQNQVSAKKGKKLIALVSPNAFPWPLEGVKADYIDPYFFFTTPSVDEGLLRHCCELFNLVGKHVCEESADVVIIYFYLGQYMRAIYNWLSAGESTEENFKNLYPHYWKMFVKYNKKFDGWIEDSFPRRTICSEAFVMDLPEYPHLVIGKHSYLKQDKFGKT